MGVVNGDSAVLSGCQNARSGIQSGRLYVLDVVEYTLEKYSSAHCLLKDGWVDV